MCFTSPRRASRKFLVVAIALIAVCRSAFAHDPGLSSTELSFGEGQIDVLLTFSSRDVAGLLAEPGGGIPADVATGPRLAALAQRAADLDFGNGAQEPQSATARFEENNAVFELRFRGAPETGRLTFHSALLKELPFGHRQAFAARNRAGAEIERHLLSAREDSVMMTGVQMPAEGAAMMNFIDFLRLGIRHIWTGYDHLLFLFALLLVCRSLRDAAVVISFFTVAHSITLTLATFNLVQLSSRFVEPAIAASIVYVGVENLIRGGKHIRGRGALTFAFGLVHGLGFAAVLRELGVATGPSAAIPLISFNGGVEIGQLAAAAVAWPIISSLRQRTTFWPRIGVPACSALVVLAGSYWLLERTLLAPG